MEIRILRALYVVFQSESKVSLSNDDSNLKKAALTSSVFFNASHRRTGDNDFQTQEIYLRLKICMDNSKR